MLVPRTLRSATKAKKYAESAPQFNDTVCDLLPPALRTESEPQVFDEADVSDTPGVTGLGRGDTPVPDAAAVVRLSLDNIQ